MSDRSSIGLLIAAVVVGVLMFGQPPASPPRTSEPAAKRAEHTTKASEDPIDPADLAINRLLAEFWAVDPTAQMPDLAQRFRASNSRAFIATVPDPADSSVAYVFDQYLESFQVAASAAGYTLDRFQLPWSAAPGSKLTVTDFVDGDDIDSAGNTAHHKPWLRKVSHKTPPKPEYRERPGALLFRSGTARDVALLVLLVGETPTSGIHQKAFSSALSYIARLAPSDATAANPIFVLGPMFSGTAVSISGVLQSWNPPTDPLAPPTNRKTKAAGPAYTVQLISGAANVESLPDVLEASRNARGVAASFQAMTWPRDITQRALYRFLTDHDSTNENTVLFAESGTSYGRLTEASPSGPQPLHPIGGAPQLHPISVTYPLHISQIRSEYARAGLLSSDPTVSLNAAARSSLRVPMDGGDDPQTDIPPALFSGNAAMIGDLELSTLLEDLGRERVKFVGVLGTNAYDRLFLVRRVREQLPNVQLFTTGGDLLYLDPNWSRDLVGMWVATSYPLNPLTQISSRPTKPSAAFRRQFANSNNVASYNAFLAILTEMASWAKPPPPAAENLIDAMIDADAATGYPDLWITVVGRKSFYPVARFSVADLENLKVIDADEAQRVRNFLWLPPVVSAPAPIALTPRYVPSSAVVLIALLSIGSGVSVFLFLAAICLRHRHHRVVQRLGVRCERTRIGRAALDVAQAMVRHVDIVSCQIRNVRWALGYPEPRSDERASSLSGTRMLLSISWLFVLLAMFRFTLSCTIPPHAADAGAQAASAGSLATTLFGPSLVGERWVAALIIHAAHFVFLALNAVLVVAVVYGGLVVIGAVRRRVRESAHAVNPARTARPTTGWSTADRRQRPGLAAPLLTAFALAAAVLLNFAQVVVAQGGSSVGDIHVANDAILRFERAVELGSGLSPLVPTALFGACALLVLAADAKRQRLRRYAKGLREVWSGSPFTGLVTELEHALGLRGAAPASLVIGLAVACAVCAVLYEDHIATIDGGVFTLSFGRWSHTLAPWDLAVGILFIALVGDLTAMEVRFFLGWRRLRRLLRAVGATPLLYAFDRLPRRFGNSLGLQWSRAPGRLSDLRYSVNQLSLLARHGDDVRSAAAGMPLAAVATDALGAVDGLTRELGEREFDPSPTYAYESDTQAALAGAAARIWRALERYRECEPLRSWKDKAPDVLQKTGPEAVLTAQEHYARIDDVTDFRVHLAEDFVAAELSRYFGYIFVHLKNLLSCATIGAVLLLLAVASYPFQPQQLLLRCVITGMIVLIAAFFVVLVQVDRDEILSRTADRTPNKVNFDARFFTQAFTFAGVPLLTLLVTQFPAFEEQLSSVLTWLH